MRTVLLDGAISLESVPRASGPAAQSPTVYARCVVDVGASRVAKTSIVAARWDSEARAARRLAPRPEQARKLYSQMRGAGFACERRLVRPRKRCSSIET